MGRREGTAAMNRALDTKTRVADGYLFATHRDRCLYIGTETRNRRRMVERTSR